MIRLLAIALTTAVLSSSQAKDDPQYEYWSNCKAGSWVKNRMEMENGGKKVEFESTTRLIEVTADKVVVESFFKVKEADRTVESPPEKKEIRAREPQRGKIVAERDEEISISGKTLQCRYYEIETEAGEKKQKTTLKAWMSKEIPG